MNTQKTFTTKEKADTYENMDPFLQNMYQEFKDLSKKNPDAIISKAKIKIANRLLEKIQKIFDDKSYADLLDVLNEDDLPQASDVALILSQYQSAMRKFKDEHHGWAGSEHIWFIK